MNSRTGGLTRPSFSQPATMSSTHSICEVKSRTRLLEFAETDVTFTARAASDRLKRRESVFVLMGTHNRKV